MALIFDHHLDRDQSIGLYKDAQIRECQLNLEVNFYTDIRSAIKNYSNEELDVKPYEADMRHLLNTYIQADAVDEIGDLQSLSLGELIIKTGIHDAIARKINQKGKLSNNNVAETIKRIKKRVQK